MVDVTVNEASGDVSVGARATADTSELTVIVEVVVGVVVEGLVEATDIRGSGVVCDDACANTPPLPAALGVVVLTAAFA